MVSNPPTPIFVFESDTPVVSSPLPVLASMVYSPSKIPPVRFPTLPVGSVNGPNANPMGFPPLTPPHIIISNSPAFPTISPAPVPQVTIPQIVHLGAKTAPRDAPSQMVLPNLGSLAQQSNPNSNPAVSTSPTTYATQTSPMVLKGYPVGMNTPAPSYHSIPSAIPNMGSPSTSPNSITVSNYNSYPNVMSSYEPGFARCESPYGSFMLPSLRSPGPAELGMILPSMKSPNTLTAVKSPLLSVLSPRSRQAPPSPAFQIAPLTPNSISGMLTSYHNQWLPENHHIEPVRGVANVNTVYQQQTAVNHYHPVTAPTVHEESSAMDMASIHFSVGGSKEDSVAVANHMRSLINVTSSFANYYRTTCKNLPPFRGLVNQIQFNEALSVYENNQVYYQECMDDKSLTVADITAGLVQLEQWFAAIIEPDSNDNAADHRKFLQSRGVTAHCDPELYPYLSSLLVS